MRDTDGGTPLGSAAFRSTTRSMLTLLRHGAKVGARANNGNTPLHSACSGQFQGLEAAVDLLLRWGADETALNNHGRTPVKLLDSGGILSLDCCSLDEIDRVRQMFARAPTDRVWRRRSWLVILRSRASKVAKVSRETGRDGAVDADDAAGRQEGRVHKVARREHSERGGFDGPGQAVGESEGLLCGLIRWLVDLKMEGVFRTVVEFL